MMSVRDKMLKLGFVLDETKDFQYWTRDVNEFITEVIKIDLKGKRSQFYKINTIGKTFTLNLGFKEIQILNEVIKEIQK